MANTYIYYIDADGNYYIDGGSNYYISGVEYSEPLIRYLFYKYKPYIYNSSTNKVYTAYIKNSSGEFVKYNPYIYTKVEIAIANLATVGFSRVGQAEFTNPEIAIAGDAIVGIAKAG